MGSRFSPRHSEFDSTPIPDEFVSNLKRPAHTVRHTPDNGAQRGALSTSRKFLMLSDRSLANAKDAWPPHLGVADRIDNLPEIGSKETIGTLL